MYRFKMCNTIKKLAEGVMLSEVQWILFLRKTTKETNKPKTTHAHLPVCVSNFKTFSNPSSPPQAMKPWSLFQEIHLNRTLPGIAIWKRSILYLYTAITIMFYFKNTLSEHLKDTYASTPDKLISINRSVRAKRNKRQSEWQAPVKLQHKAWEKVTQHMQ